MANGQTNISGGKTLIGTAQPSDVRMGMTYADGKELRDGTLNLTNLTPENIKSGVTIGGVEGTLMDILSYGVPKKIYQYSSPGRYSVQFQSDSRFVYVLLIGAGGGGGAGGGESCAGGGGGGGGDTWFIDRSCYIAGGGAGGRGGGKKSDGSSGHSGKKTIAVLDITDEMKQVGATLFVGNQGKGGYYGGGEYHGPGGTGYSDNGTYVLDDNDRSGKHSPYGGKGGLGGTGGIPSAYYYSLNGVLVGNGGRLGYGHSGDFGSPGYYPEDSGNVGRASGKPGNSGGALIIIF